jgi:lipopolysaccharide export system ATP-binding protein
MSIVIHTKDLVKTYGGRSVVNHVSVDVKQGEIVGLLGPNGAGKTTTFHMVVGLIKPDEGDVFLNEQNITGLAMYKRAKMGIGYLPQEASVFRKLSVEDNIAAVLEMTKLSKREQKEKLESLLEEFRLQHVRKSNGDVLSGGERRRTEIARALAVDPKFILLDEPFAGIDPIAVEDIQAIVARLKYKNIGILITDHNVTETLSICDRAYLLIEGKIFEHGSAEELAANEQVRKLYLGRNFQLKRKDYLHEEAKSDLNKDPQNFETVIEKCIRETERKIEILRKIGIYKYNLRMSLDIGLDSYCSYLDDVKRAIIQTYGSDSNILHAIGKIPAIRFKDYKRRFKVYDVLVFPVFFSYFLIAGNILFLPIMYLIYRPIFRELLSKCNDARSALDEVRLLIHAKNN